MMPLTVMLAITEETEAGRLPGVAIRAARLWEADPGTLRYVRSSANHIFRFKRAARASYLRLSPASERQPAGLEAELAFVEAVGTGGVPVARPLPSSNGNRIERIPGELEEYYAVVFSGLQGQAWLQPADLTPAMYRSWGETVGRIHKIAQGYHPPGPRRPTWQEQIAGARPWLEGEPALRSGLDRAAAWLARLPQPEGSFGLIHGDPELDNLVWDGNTFQVLDFDDAHYHWYAHDVALALEEVWEEGENPAEKTGWFLEGYQGVSGIAPIDTGLIPRFLRLNRVLTAAHLVRAYAGLPEEGLPEWVRTLRLRHRQLLAELREEWARPFAW